jgi:hypothetical protein
MGDRRAKIAVQLRSAANSPAPLSMQSTFRKPYTASSCLGDLPGHTAALDWETPGAEVARIFKSNPDLPGIMVTNKGERTGGLSQNRFLRLIGRPFGVELSIRVPCT